MSVKWRGGRETDIKKKIKKKSTCCSNTFPNFTPGHTFIHFSFNSWGETKMWGRPFLGGGGRETQGDCWRICVHLNPERKKEWPTPTANSCFVCFPLKRPQQSEPAARGGWRSGRLTANNEAQKKKKTETNKCLHVTFSQCWVSFKI